MPRNILAFSVLSKQILANAKLWERKSEQTFVGNPGSDSIYFEGNFPDLLEDLYKFEYTYSMLRNNAFSGNERRKANILQHVEKVFREVLEEVRNVLVAVFEEWLRHHAITDPNTWARDRVLGQGDSFDSYNEVFNSLIWEYGRYAHPHLLRVHDGGGQLKELTEKDLMNNPEMDEPLWDLMGGKEQFVEDWVQTEMDEWTSYPEDITERYDLEANATEDEVEFAIRERFEEMELQEAMEYFDPDFDSLLRNADPDDTESFLIAFAEYMVFPVWFDYWQPQGIEETRNRIEQMTMKLQNPNQDLNRAFADVNIALNIAHQTGDMTEYIENVTQDSNLKEHLQELSDGKIIPEVLPVLRESGVKV
jgi:hypothetical protein